MRSKLTGFKLSVLENEYDIIAIVETWLYPDILVGEFLSENDYNIFRRDRCTNRFQRGGGIFVASKSHFTSSVFPLKHTDVEQLCVRLSSSSNTGFNLQIFLSYIPPASPEIVYSKHLENILASMDGTYSDDNCIILGDFNLPNIAWKSEPDNTLIPFNVTSVVERLFIDSLTDNNLVQINNIPNKYGKFLDFVFLSDEFQYTVSSVDHPLASTDSHHKAISINLVRYSFFSCSRPLVTPDNAFNFRKADYSRLIASFLTTDWLNVFTGLNLNARYMAFIENLHDAFSSHVPKLRRRNNNNSDPPWFTSSLKRLKNARNKAHKRLIKHGGCQLRNAFVQLRREYQFLHRFLYRNYIWSIESELKSSSKRFWVFINQIRGSSGFPSQMSYNGLTSSDLQSTVDLFADYFKTVYNEDDSSAVTDFTSLSTITDLGSLVILESDVIMAIDSLDDNYTPDRDCICNSFLKNCCQVIAFPLQVIFQDSLRSGVFLDRWKFSCITPIFKSGAKHCMENYRGISQLMVIPKLFEAIVKIKIYECVKNGLTPYQHGFVAGRSTTTNLVLYTNKIINSIESGSQIDSVYTDFSKAFDRVVISLLIHKLSALGFHSSLLRWLSSFLTNRWQVVKILHCSSPSFKALSGVPQGSHLGPLLFILMMNDLPLCFETSSILMYADDVKLFANINSYSDALKLQSDINLFSAWCSRNGFALNLSKCSVMSFYRCKKPYVFQYMLNSSVLPSVLLVKDLGIFLDVKLSFIPHYDYMCAKACKMLGFLRRNTREFRDFLTLKSLYCSLVRSLLEYGCVVWNPYYSTHIDRIERVQKSFSRLALVRYGFNYNDLPPYPVRCKLLGLESLSDRRKISSISLIQDILTNKLLCQDLLSLLKINIPTRILRSTHFLSVPFHSTNYGRYEPITNCTVLYNEYCQYLDFNVPRSVWKSLLKSVFYSS